jgi:hypothetical protein
LHSHHSYPDHLWQNDGQNPPHLYGLAASLADRLGYQSAADLGDLLSAIVRAEVAAFQDRQESRRLTQILTADRIEHGLEQGKVTAGQSDLAQTVDVEQEIDNALQSFADGFYCIFIDDEQQMELNDPVLLQPNSQLMFLRLMPLVGG